MLDRFFDKGFKHVDTARTYAGGNTEKIIGDLMPKGSERSGKCGTLATKAGPWDGPSMMSGNGGLGAAQLRGDEPAVFEARQCGAALSARPGLRDPDRRNTGGGEQAAQGGQVQGAWTLQLPVVGGRTHLPP
eukprot:1661929-Rhodomonas_salina.1